MSRQAERVVGFRSLPARLPPSPRAGRDTTVISPLRSDMWSARSHFDTFKGTFEAACDASYVPSLSLSQDDQERVYSELAEAAKRWERLAPGEPMTWTSA